jgi:hypothetical protein
MTRRWALVGALSLLIGSALLIALAIRTPAASPTTIEGWWWRDSLAGEAFSNVSANPHQLSTLLRFRQDGIFTAEDLHLYFTKGWEHEAESVRYPGTYTFVYPGTFTFDTTQHIQLTIGTITAMYEIDFEDGPHFLSDRLILRNQGVTYTYRRAEPRTLEM